MKIKATFNEMHHYSTQLIDKGGLHYFYHNVDEYWDFEISGDVYRVCFSTGLTFHNNNIDLPTNDYTLSEKQSHPIFWFINELWEEHFDDDEFIQEVLEALREEGLPIQTKEELLELYTVYNEIYPSFDEQEISELEIKQKLAMENMPEHIWFNKRY